MRNEDGLVEPVTRVPTALITEAEKKFREVW
jgi:hypothetical protein